MATLPDGLDPREWTPVIQEMNAALNQVFSSDGQRATRKALVLAQLRREHPNAATDAALVRSLETLLDASIGLTADATVSVLLGVLVRRGLLAVSAPTPKHRA